MSKYRVADTSDFSLRGYDTVTFSNLKDALIHCAEEIAEGNATQFEIYKGTDLMNVVSIEAEIVPEWLDEEACNE